MKKLLIVLFIVIIASSTIGGCRHAAPLIGGMVVGAVIADAINDCNGCNEHERRRYEERRRHRDHRDRHYREERCYEEIRGEWRIDSYGNRYWKDYRRPRRIQVPCY